jgi:hypothetical protein
MRTRYQIQWRQLPSERWRDCAESYSIKSIAESEFADKITEDTANQCDYRLVTVKEEVKEISRKVIDEESLEPGEMIPGSRLYPPQLTDVDPKDLGIQVKNGRWYIPRT